MRLIHEFSNEMIEWALMHLDEIKADFGGADLYDPIKSIFEDEKFNSNIKQRIFIFTDGEVSNKNQVTELIQEYSN